MRSLARRIAAWWRYWRSLDELYVEGQRLANRCAGLETLVVAQRAQKQAWRTRAEDAERALANQQRDADPANRHPAARCYREENARLNTRIDALLDERNELVDQRNELRGEVQQLTLRLAAVGDHPANRRGGE